MRLRRYRNKGVFMKVSVKKKESAIEVAITTEFIKLESAMNGETCLMRGKKLYPGDKFGFEGETYLITNAAE